MGGQNQLSINLQGWHGSGRRVRGVCMCSNCCESITGIGDGAVTGGDVDVSMVCAGAMSESSQLWGMELLQTVTLTCPWCVQVLEKLSERVIAAQKDGAVTACDVDMSVVCAGAGAAV